MSRLLLILCLSSGLLAATRDPFLPPRLATPTMAQASRATSTELTVTGIIYDDAQPVAFVSVSGQADQLVVGQRLGSYRVVRISPTTVLLKSKSKKIILSVGDTSPL